MRASTRRFLEAMGVFEGSGGRRTDEVGRCLQTDPMALAMFVLGEVATGLGDLLKEIPDTRFGRKLREHLDRPVHGYLVKTHATQTWLNEMAERRDEDGRLPDPRREQERLDGIHQALLFMGGVTDAIQGGPLSVWSHRCTRGERVTLGIRVPCETCGMHPEDVEGTQAWGREKYGVRFPNPDPGWEKERRKRHHETRLAQVSTG